MLFVDRVRAELYAKQGSLNASRDLWRRIKLMFEPDRVQRFMAFVERRPFQCWPWTGALDTGGYGVFTEQIGGRNVMLRSHRFMFELVFGPLEPGQLVLHSCDNPPCVNPMHIRAGTHKDNERDKILRGRRRVS